MWVDFSLDGLGTIYSKHIEITRIILAKMRNNIKQSFLMVSLFVIILIIGEEIINNNQVMLMRNWVELLVLEYILQLLATEKKWKNY